MSLWYQFGYNYLNEKAINGLKRSFKLFMILIKEIIKFLTCKIKTEKFQ